MRRARSLFVVAVAIAALAGSQAVAEAGGERLAMTTSMCSVTAGDQAASREHKAHQRYDARTGGQFSAGTDSQGRAFLRLAVSRFEFEKSVSASGETSIRIAGGGDRVTLTFAQNLITVGRGKASVGFDPRLATEDDENKVRRLLVGSRAVRAFRAIAANLEAQPSEEDDFFVTSAMVDGALVGLLDGDGGAIGRVARRIGNRQRARLQSVSARAQDKFADCVGMYENSVNWAWGQYQGCMGDASDDGWLSGINANFCGIEWIARAEVAWFQFIGCFPRMA